MIQGCLCYVSTHNMKWPVLAEKKDLPHAEHRRTTLPTRPSVGGGMAPRVASPAGAAATG
jgi:hypothetical protein